MSEPLCQCGHPAGDHENDGSGACYRLERGPCMCEKFTPPARSRAEAEKAIAAVLRKHHLFGEGPAGEVTCYCSERFANRQDHRTHVASVLADLMADAWDEGAKTLDEFHHHRRKVPGPMPPPNPYRVTDAEGDR